MPRTKGAKNKEKPLAFYEKKVAELTGKIPAVKAVEKVAKAVKKTFKLDKPKITEPVENSPETVDIKGQVLRCGNCQKILTSEVSKCPHCGVNLSWQ